MPASDHLHPGQLKMFMTANEIMDQYQPRDADREGWNGGSTTYVTSGQRGSDDPTGRTWRNHHTMRTSDREGARKLYAQNRVETSDELWDRKATEAWDYGLAQGIIDEGVQKPVSLGFERGLEGKPQVAGGHHRIAVMAEEAPDELMPVLHYESFGHARRQDQEAKQGRGGFRYT